MAGVVEALKDSLSSDPNTRMAAELKIAHLADTEEGLWEICKTVLNVHVEEGPRQMAGVLLKKYVTQKWSPYHKTFVGPAPSVEVKTRVREIIFQGLSDQARSIRTSCAHILGLIAVSDWPDEWPELFNGLVELLSGDQSAVHGSLSAMSELVRMDSLSDDQLLPVLQKLLLALIQVLGQAEIHSMATRARTVEVFRTCVEALFVVSQQHADAVREASANIFPAWLDAFKFILEQDLKKELDEKNWDGLFLRSEVFKTLDVLHSQFNRAIVPYYPIFLPSSLLHLQTLYPAFYVYHLTQSEAEPTAVEGSNITVPSLSLHIMDFLGHASKSSKAKDWFNRDKVDEVVAQAFCWAQMTSENEGDWADDPNVFVAQDGEESIKFTPRLAAFDLIANLTERQPVVGSAALYSGIERVCAESGRARDAGQEDWWRLLEAALATTGSLSEVIVEVIEDEEAAGRVNPIDIKALLTNVVPALLIQSHSFLQGRAFVFSSQFSPLLPKEMVQQYLDAAVQVIEAAEATVPVKISAIKAVHNFVLNGSNETIVPQALRITRDLGPFLLSTTEGTLSLVLDTLSAIVEVDDASWITPDLAESLVAAILEVWGKFNKDPVFISLLTDILTSLTSSKAPGVYEAVVKSALPPVCDAIAKTPLSESWITAAAIELASSLAQGAKESQLGEGFFAMLGPSLLGALKTAEDRDVIQNGTNCLTLILRKDFSQIQFYRDPATGESGLDSILAVIAKQLQSEDESGGLVIGDLIIHLLRIAGDHIVPVLPGLLQAMVSRMATAKTATFLQSLIIPFAFLIYNKHRDTVLSLLDPTPNLPLQSGSPLEIFIRTWCENAETFQGDWAGRISTLALCSCYESEWPSLNNLVVKGDIVFDAEDMSRIMTRSRTKKKPTQFTQVPFPTKALKIILHDLQASGQAQAAALKGIDPKTVDTATTDDGDDEWEEEEDLNAGIKDEEFAFLTDMLGRKGFNFGDDDFATSVDDEDLQADPVSNIDMRTHLLAFFSHCAASNTNNFSSHVAQLTESEQTVVSRAVSSK